MKQTFQDALGNATITLTYSEENNLIQATFIGVQSSETVCEAANEMLALIAEKKCRKYLSDNTRLVGGKEVSNNWTPDTFIPQIMAAGIRYLAYVTPPRAYNIRSFIELDLDLPPELEVMVFDKVEDAQQWLATK
jgi:hypothetical protein